MVLRAGTKGLAAGPAGTVSEPVGKASEPAEKASEPARRTSEPTERALEPAGRALESAERALEPAGEPWSQLGGPLKLAGRLGATWEGHLRGLEGGMEKTDRETECSVHGMWPLPKKAQQPMHHSKRKRGREMMADMA